MMADCDALPNHECMPRLLLVEGKQLQRLESFEVTPNIEPTAKYGHDHDYKTHEVHHQNGSSGESYVGAGCSPFLRLSM